MWRTQRNIAGMGECAVLHPARLGSAWTLICKASWWRSSGLFGALANRRWEIARRPQRSPVDVPPINLRDHAISWAPSPSACYAATRSWARAPGVGRLHLPGALPASAAGIGQYVFLTLPHVTWRFTAAKFTRSVLRHYIYAWRHGVRRLPAGSRRLPPGPVVVTVHIYLSWHLSKPR